MCRKKSRRARQPPRRKLGTQIRNSDNTRAETEKIRKAVRVIGDIFWSRANMSVRLAAEFNKMTHTPFVSWDQIRTAFSDMGYVFEPQDVQRCVNFVLPGTDLEQINYNEFIMKLKTTYHDMSGKL